ncbi:MAG TPA: hypothetical protein VNS32_12625 [Flavisolibacter sp.]|nr:hypothetical protein [Flavisolibacter sp.]
MLYVSSEEFNKLRPVQKRFLLEQYGTYLDASYQSGKCQVMLFWLPYAHSGFYVAVELYRKIDQVRKCTGFTDYERLDPFLKNIDVEQLYVLL